MNPVVALALGITWGSLITGLFQSFWRPYVPTFDEHAEQALAVVADV